MIIPGAVVTAIVDDGGSEFDDTGKFILITHTNCMRACIRLTNRK